MQCYFTKAGNRPFPGHCWFTSRSLAFDCDQNTQMAVLHGYSKLSESRLSLIMGTR